MLVFVNRQAFGDKEFALQSALNSKKKQTKKKPTCADDNILFFFSSKTESISSPKLTLTSPMLTEISQHLVS